MTASSRPPGRPRSEQSRLAILNAAFALLAERGYDGFAIEAVALRAGVGKTTIYRWWPSRAELAVDCFLTGTRDELRFPDTGSTARDFTEQILRLRRLLDGPTGAVLMTMLAAARVDRGMGIALRTRFVIPRRRWGVARLRAAVARGECVPTLDIAAALDLLYGPLYARLLIGASRAPSVAVVRRYLALALRAIFVRTNSRK